MTNKKISIARVSLAVSLVVLTVKYAAYAVSSSDALLSDAIETILNVVAAAGTLWAVSIASLPADDNHPYGHGKAEYLSAVIEGVLVVLAAIGILIIAIHDWWHPHPITSAWRGIALNGVGGLINLIWARILITSGRRQSSQALTAAGEHVQSDVWATCALVIGVALIPILHWPQLDPLLSALVALNVLRAGFGMMRRSMSGLMDAAPGSEMTAEVSAIISRHGEGALEAHDLRMRRVGSLTFVEFHLVVPSAMTVASAHDICDRIEAALREKLGRSSIHIHVEPADKAKHSGVLVLT